MDRPHILLPSFVVGVTGHIDPVLGAGDRAEDLRETLKLVFEFLQYGAQAEAGMLYDEIKARLPHREQAPGLGQWPGLGRTPLMVLTSLAPGADSIVAEVALRKHIAVRAPLPFPKDVYRNASMFVRDASKPTEEEKAAQAHFVDLVTRIGNENVFPVRLAEEISWDDDRLEKQMKAAARDKSAEHRRYQAAGEYVASHCDLLLALWDSKALNEVVVPLLRATGKHFGDAFAKVPWEDQPNFDYYYSFSNHFREAVAGDKCRKFFEARGTLGSYLPLPADVNAPGAFDPIIAAVRSALATKQSQ